MAARETGCDNCGEQPAAHTPGRTPRWCADCQKIWDDFAHAQEALLAGLRSRRDARARFHVLPGGRA